MIKQREKTTPRWDARTHVRRAICQQAKKLEQEGRIDITKKFSQHGDCSVFEHCANVAYVSCMLFRQMHVDADWDELIRGSLLHDYFLYDWHTSPKEHRPHGFTHARTALKNARRDFSVNMLEAEMIYCHMFPMNILRLPMHRESMILCIADKIVSTKETLEGGKRLIQRTGGVLIGAVH